jgi:hypothetical protein
MEATATERTQQRNLWLAAVSLLVIQVVHGAIPGPDEGGGSLVGPVVGMVLLVASIAVVVGLARGRAWSRPLLGATGAVVALGFLSYHALPVKTPLNYPYWGDGGPANLGQWLPVLGSIAVGAWCWWAARSSPDPGVHPDTSS